MAQQSLTETAHQIVLTALKPGDIAIDATAGNGHDTLFLANAVGPTGMVYAFDVQSDAIESTARHLAEHDCDNFELINQCHTRMFELLSPRLADGTAAVMFNLGYLPGSDKQVATNSQSSVDAVSQAAILLRPRGVITVIAYTGHPGGLEEADAVENCMSGLSSDHFQFSKTELIGKAAAPRLLVIRKVTVDQRR